MSWKARFEGPPIFKRNKLSSLWIPIFGLTCLFQESRSAKCFQPLEKAKKEIDSLELIRCDPKLIEDAKTKAWIVWGILCTGVFGGYLFLTKTQVTKIIFSSLGGLLLIGSSIYYNTSKFVVTGMRVSQDLEMVTLERNMGFGTNSVELPINGLAPNTKQPLESDSYAFHSTSSPFHKFLIMPRKSYEDVGGKFTNLQALELIATGKGEELKTFKTRFDQSHTTQAKQSPSKNLAEP
jgi:hypothetical protein